MYPIDAGLSCGYAVNNSCKGASVVDVNDAESVVGDSQAELVRSCPQISMHDAIASALGGIRGPRSGETYTGKGQRHISGGTQLDDCCTALSGS